MRLAFLTLLLALSFAPTTLAQTQQRFFGYYFGMTADQARALTPHATWIAAPPGIYYEEGRVAIAAPDRFVPLGGKRFGVVLEFAHDQLDRVVLMAGGQVGSADECNRTLFSVITELEETFGSFDGPPMNEEQLQDFFVERTVRGGEVRVYGHPLIGILGFANARGDYFVEARSIYQITPWPGAEGTPPCTVVVQFEPTAPSVRVPRVAQSAPDSSEFDAAYALAAPEWTEAADLYEIDSATPRIAAEAGIQGNVVLDCLVQADHSVRCRVESEEPQGLGFGEAARLIAERYRIAERVGEVESVGTRVRLPVHFGSDHPY